MIIRMAIPSDREQIAKLYHSVAGSVKGISRRPHEITETYIYSLLNRKESQIVFLVAVNDKNSIIGCVHGTKNGLEMYDHILSDLTIIVDPEYQKQGIGRQLGHAFLKYVAENRPDVKRVEMEILKDILPIVDLEKVGFVKEGEIIGRIRNEDGSFSDSSLLMWENPNFKV